MDVKSPQTGLKIYEEGRVDVKAWKKLFPDLDFTREDVRDLFGGDLPKQRRKKVPTQKRDQIYNELIEICAEALVKKVETTAQLECYGCQVDHPSQRQHHVYLMMSFAERVDRCFPEAYLFWVMRQKHDDTLFQAWREQHEDEYSDEEQIWAYRLWRLDLTRAEEKRGVYKEITKYILKEATKQRRPEA